MPPLIIEGPDDDIVDMDIRTGELRTSSTFECIGNFQISLFLFTLKISLIM